MVINSPAVMEKPSWHREALSIQFEHIAIHISPSATCLSSSNPPLDNLAMPALKQKLLSDPKYFREWGDTMKDLTTASSEDPEHYKAYAIAHVTYLDIKGWHNL
jgi:hypothetical protein